MKEDFIVKWYRKVENHFMLIGGILSLLAISTPFYIMYYNNYEYNLDSFEKLGTIGDFFGGTTVGFLSFASLLFVTAAMLMQKKELELQRNEIKGTREEFEIANSNNKMSIFDSRFYNMINIHYKIISDLQIEEKKDRDVLKLLHTYFRNNLYYHMAMMNNSNQDLIIIRMWEKKLEKERPLDLYKALKYYYKTNCTQTDEMEELFQKSLQDIEEKKSYSLNLNSVYSKTIKGKNFKWKNYLIDYKHFDTTEYQLSEILELEEEFDKFIREKSENTNELYTLAFHRVKNSISHYYLNFFQIINYIEKFDFKKLDPIKYQEIKDDYYAYLKS